MNFGESIWERLRFTWERLLKQKFYKRKIFLITKNYKCIELIFDRSNFVLGRAIVPSGYNWNRAAGKSDGEIFVEKVEEGLERLKIKRGGHLDAVEESKLLAFDPELQDFVGNTIMAYKVGNHLGSSDDDVTATWTPVTTFDDLARAAQGHEVTLTWSLRNPHGLNLFFKIIYLNKIFYLNKSNHHQIF